MNEEITKKSIHHQAKKWLVNLLLLALIIYVGSLAYSQILKSQYIGRDINAVATINVSGDAHLFAAPDIAVMDFSVKSEAKTVADAVKDNTLKMNAITQAVKTLAVDAKDLQTTNYNISPRYEYVKVLMPNTPNSSAENTQRTEYEYIPNGKQVLAGYEVTSTLTIKMRDLSKIGDIIQAATDAGANEAGSLQFTIENPDTLQEQARKEAIDKAKTQAQILASQLAVKLVRIVNFSDNGQPVIYRNSAKSTMNYAAESAVPAPAIEAGQNEITSSVNITYEIQ